MHFQHTYSKAPEVRPMRLVKFINYYQHELTLSIQIQLKYQHERKLIKICCSAKKSSFYGDLSKKYQGEQGKSTEGYLRMQLIMMSANVATMPGRNCTILLWWIIIISNKLTCHNNWCILNFIEYRNNSLVRNTLFDSRSHMWACSLHKLIT